MLWLFLIIDARRNYVYASIYDNNINCILKNQYISFDVLKTALSQFGDNYTFISNDNFDFECEKYSPNIVEIVKKYKDYPTTLPHLVNPSYLKLTEAEEKNNDFKIWKIWKR